MARVIRNPRQPQSQKTPIQRPTPSPQEVEAQVKEKKKSKPRKGAKGGRYSMTKQERVDGFGLYMCKNCEWFKKKRPSRDESCQDAGIPESGLPCAIYTRQHGYFSPIKSGQAEDIDISHLDPGELQILAWRCRRATVKKLRDTLRNFRIGDKVQYYLNGQLCYGEVARLTKRFVIVDPEHGGGEVTLHPKDVELES